MRRWSLLGLIIAVGGWSGCGSSEEAAPMPTQPAPEPRVCVTESLARPRAELILRGDDLLVSIRQRETDRQREKIQFTLLPDWQVPVILPVFQDARYVPALDLSLPTWTDERSAKEDQALAQHLAQFGDGEAARKLGGPMASAAPVASQYAVEWSRFVALYAHALQQRIATGDEAAAEHFIALHEELRKLFPPDRRDAPLARALLPRGRETMKQASAAWRRRGNASLADKIDAALQGWPAARPPALTGSRNSWAKTLASQGEGKVLRAASPRRAMDLLAQPFPAEFVDDVLLFFGPTGQVEQALIVFGPRAAQNFGRPATLAPELRDIAEPAQSEATRCLYQWEGLQCELVLCPPGGTTGAWARWQRTDAAAAGTLPRELGGVHLDRSFDSNRLAVTPAVLEASVRTKQVAGPPLLAALEFDEFFLSPVGQHDLVREARWHYRSEAPLANAAEHILARFGLQRMELVAAEPKKNRAAEIRLSWEDNRTTVTLHVLLEHRGMVEASLRDRHDDAEAKARSKAVAAFERQERAARLAAGTPTRRLDRRLEQLPLGLSRAEALKLLPRGSNVGRIDLADGVIRVIQGPPLANARYMARQIVVRFNAEDRVREVRVRYENGGKPPDRHETPWAAQLLQTWSSQGGAVRGQAPEWFGRAKDLPPASPAPATYRWRDDSTELSLTLDRHGVEVLLRERSADDGPAPAFTYLSRGPQMLDEEVTLGEKWSDVVARLEKPPMKTEEGAFALLLERGVYDAVLVFVHEGKVHKISARHRKGEGLAEAQAAFLSQLANDVRIMGWPTRFDNATPTTLQAAIWFDDQTRYRLYWAESANSPARLWSEWND